MNREKPVSDASGHRQGSRWKLIIALAVVTIALSGTVWLVAMIGRTFQNIQEQELRAAAMHHACDLVATFVEKSGYTKWPRSWEELRDVDDGWSPAGPRLEDLVIVDFDADLKVLREQEATEFAAVRPRGATPNLVGEYHGFLARIRGPAEWKELPDDSRR